MALPGIGGDSGGLNNLLDKAGDLAGSPIGQMALNAFMPGVGGMAGKIADGATENGGTGGDSMATGLISGGTGFLG